MKKVTGFIAISLLILGSVAYAEVPESWFNTNMVYVWPYGSEIGISSGTPETLGFDVSWFGFPKGSSLGFETRVDIGYSLDAAPTFNRMNVFFGPTQSSVLLGGVVSYLSLGLSYTATGYDSTTNIAEHQLGVGGDLGFRLRLAGYDRWDFAFVFGAFADIALLHIVNNQRKEGFSGNVVPYVGFSFGSAMMWPYYGHWGMYNPYLYYY